MKYKDQGFQTILNISEGNFHRKKVIMKKLDDVQQILFQTCNMKSSLLVIIIRIINITGTEIRVLNGTFSKNSPNAGKELTIKTNVKTLKELSKYFYHSQMKNDHQSNKIKYHRKFKTEHSHPTNILLNGTVYDNRH